MVTDAISVEVQEVCSNILRMPIEQILPQARFIEDLNVDSLFLVELAMGLEQHFHMEIPEEDMTHILTVADMMEYIRARKVA